MKQVVIYELDAEENRVKEVFASKPCEGIYLRTDRQEKIEDASIMDLIAMFGSGMDNRVEVAMECGEIIRKAYNDKLKKSLDEFDALMNRLKGGEY